MNPTNETEQLEHMALVFTYTTCTWRFVWRGGLTVNVYTSDRETDVFMFTAATDADYPTAVDVLQRCREYMAEVLEGVR